MTEEQPETEEQIFEAACRVFRQKGYAGARMQEIADEADINKSMLHYYYRSKDKLFHEVFQREMSRFFPVIFGVLGSETSLDQKVGDLIDAYYSFLQDNPYMVQFVLYEMNQHPEKFKSFIENKGIRPPKSFFDQIEYEIKQGHMDPIEPRQLLISIVGLILFPFVARTMIQSLFGIDESGFIEFIGKRRDFLKEFILNAINYRKSP